MVTMTNVLLIAGVAGLVAGGTYWLLDADSGSEPQLSGACASKGCGATLRGVF
jgi:hypothetical protein